MLTISSKGRYALRLMIDLAQHGQDDVVPLKEIAKRQRLTVKYLEIIISHLLRAQLVSSTRGKMGGYKLAIPTEQITVCDVVEAVEGKIAVTQCLSTPENLCPGFANCATIDVWAGLQKTVRDYLTNIKLSDLLKEEESSFCEGI